MRNRIIKAAGAVFLSVSLCACGSGDSASITSGPGKKWVDSDLIGAVSQDHVIREQDDFAASVNQAWKAEIGDRFYNVFQDVSDAVTANKKQALSDPSITGETIERLRAYCELASDWDKRDAGGISPLKPYIEDIESISSMDEMYDYLADPIRNPLFLSPVATSIPYVIHSGIHKDSYAVFFSAPDLSLTVNGNNDTYFSLENENAFEQFVRIREEAGYMLEQLGYSGKEASALLKACMEWEKRVASANNLAALPGLDEATYTREEAFALAGGFPLEQVVNGWGFTDTKYIILNPGYAKKLSSLCSSRYLNNIKAYLIVNYSLRSAKYLSREILDQMKAYDAQRSKEPIDDGSTEESREDKLLFDDYIGRSPMVGAMNRVYVENFFDETSTGELTSMTMDIIDGFKKIFSEEEWLSEEGKAACLDKLEAISIHIARQDFDSVDYKNLQFASAEEGGTFLDAYFASRRFEMDHIAWLSNKTYDAAYWDPLYQDFSTTIPNAFYMPATNGIYIFAGICENPIYAPELSYEEKLAGLGIIVGHEITHGFDKSGSQYDKEGIQKAWLPTADQAAFNDRNDAVASYYTTLSPYTGAGIYTGSRVNGEATADMGGIKVSLLLAGKEPSFDYDRFFRSYANNWKMNVPLDLESMLFKTDEHPLPFYRVNVGVQQFDEFYETYDVKEGDGMYLEPDKRVKVW